MDKENKERILRQRLNAYASNWREAMNDADRLKVDVRVHRFLEEQQFIYHTIPNYLERGIYYNFYEENKGERRWNVEFAKRIALECM